jgi:hypothetical protein
VRRERHETVLVLEAQRREQCRVDDAEDRRVGADAERERQRGYDGERGPAPKGSQAVPDVLANRCHRNAPVRTAQTLDAISSARQHHRIETTGVDLYALRTDGGIKMKAVIALRLFCPALAALAGCGQPSGSSSSDAEKLASGAQRGTPAACADLAALALPNTTINKTEMVPAGAFVPPGPPPPQLSVRPDYSTLPAFCRVAASIKPTSDSDIRFEVWLPAQ